LPGERSGAHGGLGHRVATSQGCISDSVSVRRMKYLLVLLFLASIASLEFIYEFAVANGWGTGICLTAPTDQESANDVLIQHLQSHH
jgi:hypothetical protein